MVNFLRRTWSRYAKLGKGRKKKQVWRAPKGRDNKMREKRRGYPAVVSIGYGTDKSIKNTENGKKLVEVRNMKELENLKKGEIVKLGNIGKKKKIELLEECTKKGLEVYKTNPKKFVEKNSKTKTEANKK